MAKVKAPLLSMRASGTIGKNIVFGAWRGVPYTRQHVIPANPQSAEQTKTRNTFTWLNEAFRLLPALATQPWQLAALGRPFTDRNSFIKNNLANLRAEILATNFAGSPGARGGPAMNAFTAVTGAGAPGTFDVTWTAGPLPTGWTILKAVALAIRQQNPQNPFLGSTNTIEDLTSAYAGSFSGLVASTVFVVNGWFIYTRSDGLLAASPSISALVTSHP